MTDAKQRCWACNAVITWGQSTTACDERCRQVLYAESYRIARHKEQSYCKSRPWNLHLGEWAETLRHYNWRCAYCTGPFESIDHFTPVGRGGATWVGNVVPACMVCQVTKGGQLPLEGEAIPREVMERIAHYLECRAQVAQT
jgi:5-methylcytosine-specific restriction endonuclease McrA